MRKNTLRVQVHPQKENNMHLIRKIIKNPCLHEIHTNIENFPLFSLFSLTHTHIKPQFRTLFLSQATNSRLS